MFTTDPDTTVLLRAAAEWRLLALLFSCPRSDWHAEVAALAREVEDPQLNAAAEAAQTEASEGLYHTNFGPGGPAAPREISHQQATLSGQFLAELCACYAAFAYQSPWDEPPDHVAVQADFVGYLCLKEAYARSCGDDEAAAVTAEAARGFMADHLALIAEPLARALADSDIRYLAEASAVLLDRVGPAPVLPTLSDEPLACVASAGLPVCEDDVCGLDEDL